MKIVLDQTLAIRKGYYHILKTTPREELLKIPAGFNNNIWWNIAHVVVTQQKLIYGLGGLPMLIPNEMVAKFQKGSTPDGTATDEEIDQVKKLLFTTIEKTIEDYDNGVFKSYNEYTTSANVTLSSVNDATAFNFFHEGLHYGSILALKRAIKA